MIFDLLNKTISLAIAATITCMIVSSLFYYLRFKITSRRPAKVSRATTPDQQTSSAGVA